MFCKNCGSEIKANEKFCSKCGSPVENSPVLPKQTTASFDSNNTSSINVGNLKNTLNLPKEKIDKVFKIIATILYLIAELFAVTQIFGNFEYTKEAFEYLENTPAFIGYIVYFIPLVIVTLIVANGIISANNLLFYSTQGRSLLLSDRTMSGAAALLITGIVLKILAKIFDSFEDFSDFQMITYRTFYIYDTFTKHLIVVGIIVLVLAMIKKVISNSSTDTVA